MGSLMEMLTWGYIVDYSSRESGRSVHEDCRVVGEEASDGLRTMMPLKGCSGTRRVCSVVFSLDGVLVLTTSGDGLAKVWTAAKSQTYRC